MRRTFAGVSLSIAALALIFAAAPASPAFANSVIVIQNGNAPGVGFNDPTPAAPVGGNPGVTLGQQRLNAFQHAADIWGATLDSNVTIQILATFEPLNCTATTATLGSAGTRFVLSDFPAAAPFPGPEFPATWYGQALADKRAGQEVLPGEADIRARFNSNLGNVGCLTGIGWYLGFDANHGTQIDLVTVLLHEFGHGLNFQQFATLSSGAQINNQTDIYGRHILDTTTGLRWNQMTNAQRAASAINSFHVVWDGAQVTSEIPSVLAVGVPNLRVDAPASVAGNYAVGAASFGPQLTAAGVSGEIVKALDAANAGGPTTFDACTAITNAADVAGKIALVDRGTCTFVVKALNVQAAGAIAMVVADNAAGSPPAGLGGADPTITIPSVRITLPDGNAIKGALASGTVSGALLLDTTLRAGADSFNRAQLNAPVPVSAGSSISHWDPIAFPNQLMEPAINDDLTHQVTGVDLTLALLRDVGWFPDADIDGRADANDNCPHDANADQADNDGDNLGDVCDPDDDNDGVMDGADNCQFTANPGQADNDGDGQGDVCDADDDNDGVLDGADNCPTTANADQVDFDRDHIGDACDPFTGPTVSKEQCMGDNWKRFDVPARFTTQGGCVCYVSADATCYTKRTR